MRKSPAPEQCRGFLYGSNGGGDRVFRQNRDFLTCGTDVVRRCPIACDKRIPYRCSDTKSNRDSHTNILINGEKTGTVFGSTTDFPTRCDGWGTTTFCDSHTCLRKRGDGDRDTDRGRLITYRRASLNFLGSWFVDNHS